MRYQGTPSPDELQSLLARAQAEQMDRVVIERLSVILHFAENKYSIVETCRTFNISRSTFHRWMQKFDPSDLTTLADKSHEPHTLRQSSLSSETVDLIRRYRMRYPNMGKERIAELLQSDHRTHISASTVGRVIEKECLYFAETPLHWKKRLDAPTVKAADPFGSQHHTTQQSSYHVPIAPAHDTVIQEPSRAEVPGITISWRTMTRLLIVISIVTNFVFAGAFLISAFVEHNAELHQKRVQAAENQSQELVHTAAPDLPPS